MLIDLHNHTAPRSWDSLLTPDDLVERAKHAGIDGICLTEHDDFWTFEAARELGRKHDFLVLPGVEINTEDGHLLVFGIDRYVFGMHHSSFLKSFTDRAGGVVIAAHPYRRAFREPEGPWIPPYDQQLEDAGGSPIFQLVSLIETLNGKGSPRQNQFSADLCRARGLPSCGGSDAHEPKEAASCATEFEGPIQGLDDLIRELRSGRCRPVALKGKVGPADAPQPLPTPGPSPSQQGGLS